MPGELDLVVANLPYLPASQRGRLRHTDLGSEPPFAIFAPGDGLGPNRRLLEASEQHLAPDGFVVLQYRGSVFEAPREGLSELLAELEESAALAA